MRAGYYAEFCGREFRCVNPYKALIRLEEAGSLPQPERFELDARGRWTRLVERDQVSRRVTVRTDARWRGHAVAVVLVEDDQAVIQQEGCPPPDDPEVVAIDNGWWQAPVPVAELTDVESHETDLLPQPRS